MTKNFETRVIREGIVDTKSYRYTYHVTATSAEIRRISLDALDTTAALNVQSDSNPSGWKIIKIYR